jgi:hypothetical protein
MKYKGEAEKTRFIQFLAQKMQISALFSRYALNPISIMNLIWGRVSFYSDYYYIITDLSLKNICWSTFEIQLGFQLCQKILYFKFD